MDRTVTKVLTHRFTEPILMIDQHADGSIEPIQPRRDADFALVQIRLALPAKQFKHLVTCHLKSPVLNSIRRIVTRIIARSR